MAVPTYVVKAPTVGGLRNSRNPRLGRVGPNESPITRPTPRPPVFKWDWNQLDADGENQLARARQALMQRTGLMAGTGADGKPTFTQTGTGAADADLQRALQMTAAQRVAAQQSANDGERQADSNAASRGIYNSGIRLANRGRVNASLMSQLSALAAQDTSATEGWKRSIDDATANFLMDRRAVETSAAQRAWRAFLQRFPNAVRG